MHQKLIDLIAIHSSIEILLWQMSCDLQAAVNKICEWYSEWNVKYIYFDIYIK